MAYYTTFGGTNKIQDRLKGLDCLREICAKKTVLDLGCAEGLIARRFLWDGAALVHGMDSNGKAVEEAYRACNLYERGFWRVDFNTVNENGLSHPVVEKGVNLRSKYDIVLCLGVIHHLKQRKRIPFLKWVIGLTREHFALRTPGRVMRKIKLRELLKEAGWESWDRLCIMPEDKENGLGALVVVGRTDGDRGEQG